MNCAMKRQRRRTITSPSRHTTSMSQGSQGLSRGYSPFVALNHSFLRQVRAVFLALASVPTVLVLDVSRLPIFLPFPSRPVRTHLCTTSHVRVQCQLQQRNALISATTGEYILAKITELHYNTHRTRRDEKRPAQCPSARHVTHALLA
jgi:hypothetical protein